MTTEKHDSVVDKIKKLFAMAQRAKNNDGSSNEAEASAAMAKAQELLAKYNLDLKTIHDAAEKSGAAVTEGKREKTQVKKSAMYKWQREFWAGLAQANYCWHWVVDTVGKTNRGENRPVKRHVILGSEANVAAVIVMGEYLCEVIERIIPYVGTERLSKAALSWREGCAQRLIERVYEKMEAMKKSGVTVEGSSCTALAVRDMADAEYAANYDAAYGKGAYARMKQREAEWEAGRAEREAQRAREALTTKPETVAEMLKRQKQEARWERQYQRRQEREAARLDYHAYNAGRREANTINLDAQVKAGKPQGELQ